MTEQVEEVARLVDNQLERLMIIMRAAAGRPDLASKKVGVIKDIELVVSYHEKLRTGILNRDLLTLRSTAASVSGLSKGLGDRVWTSKEACLNELMHELLQSSLKLLSNVESEIRLRTDRRKEPIGK